MTYFVETYRDGCRWFLRGTTWTSEWDRRDLFPSYEAGYEALKKTKKFCHPEAYRFAEITMQKEVIGA